MISEAYIDADYAGSPCLAKDEAATRRSLIAISHAASRFCKMITQTYASTMIRRSSHQKAAARLAPGELRRFAAIGKAFHCLATFTPYCR